MGCDIHFYVEVETSEGIWEEVKGPVRYTPWDEAKTLPVTSFYNGRNYRLFGRLAGVRNYGGVTPLSPPRGLPTDCSESVRAEFDIWGSDAHSTSWLTLDELLQISELEFISDVFLETTIPNMLKLQENPKKVRAVFWFDN